MATKYKLTDESIEFDGFTLYRIEALTSFGDVTAGDKGGFVDIFGRINIDDRWTGWVYGDAKAYGGSWLHENASVRDNGILKGKGLLYGNAQIRDNAVVEGGSYGENVRILGDTIAGGSSWAYGTVTYNTSIPVSGGIIAGVCTVEDY